MLKYEEEVMLGLIARKSRHSSGVDVLHVFCWCCVGFFFFSNKRKGESLIGGNTCRGICHHSVPASAPLTMWL